MSSRLWATLLKLFIPPRRNRRGKRSGFVHYMNVKDVHLLSIKLDNIVLDGRKIYANLPRFKKMSKEDVSQGVRT